LSGAIGRKCRICGGELVHQVDVRVEAQVADALDHELALGVAELLLEIVEPVPQRPVLRVAGPGPQAQVPVAGTDQ
jgi:hypothetical protein